MKKLYFLLIIAFSLAAKAQPIINQPNDLNSCNASGFSIFDLTTNQDQIMQGLDASFHNLTFHVSQSDANANINSILNTTSYTNATQNFQTIYVRVEEINNVNSFSTISFNINVVENPQIYSFTSTAYVCYGSEAILNIVGTPNCVVTYSIGNSSYNLNNITLDSNGNGTINFQYINSDSLILQEEICLTQISNNICTNVLNNCTTFNFSALILWDEGNTFIHHFETPFDGIANFNLLTISNSFARPAFFDEFQDNSIIERKFFTSLIDAQNNTNNIVNPENYLNTFNPQTIYLKIKNLISNCEELIDFAIRVADESLNVNIPDNTLKLRLLNAGDPNDPMASTESIIYNSNNNTWTVSNYHEIDVNNDREIQFSEAQAIKYLAIGGYQGYYIHDFTGLEAFVNLEFLEASNNLSNNIDLSTLLNLKVLYCGAENNNIGFTLGDVSHLTELRKIVIGRAHNIELDFSQNNNLTDISFQGCWSLNYLNIKNGNPNLNLDLGIENLPNYICANEENIAFIQQHINNYGDPTINYVNSYCSFNPGGTFYTINGNNRFDTNANGCESTDINFPNLNFTISNGTNSGTFISNNSGFYTFPVSEGTHTLTPNLQNPSYFTISPSSVTASFPSQASPLLQDFCITPNGTHSDVQISLIPIGVARPGFNATYKLVYKNVGNQLENGSIIFTSSNSEVIDFVSSVPVFTTQNEITNLLTYSWNYTNLAPFETREIIINLNLNGPMEIPALNAGDLLSYDAQISTTNADENLLDNFAGIRQEVVNSYDPNDKTCLEGESIDPSMIGKYVHYQIRFENTGTYPAQNVVVKDMIDATKFDVSSLQMVNSSHSCYTRISGNKVEFIFENINLPFEDATNDGYIVFKIKTLPTLTINSTISNTAEIYFDYNFPIITNTATSTYQTLASSSFDFENEFTLYPNPAKNTLHISAKNNLEISSIEVYNLVGQLVIVKPNFSASIDVSNLASGTYFIKVNTEKGSGTTKFVKE